MSLFAIGEAPTLENRTKKSKAHCTGTHTYKESKVKRYCVTCDGISES